MAPSTSTATIPALVRISHLPKILVTDNGIQFVSREFEQLCEMHTINHLMSISFNLELNCLAQGMIRTFETSLKKYLEDKHNDESALQVFFIHVSNIGR